MKSAVYVPLSLINCSVTVHWEPDNNVQVRVHYTWISKGYQSSCYGLSL
jgi:hypothetical protein